MGELHDWHVTAYMLAVRGLIDTCRIREVDGVFIVDNDPQKETEWDRLETKNKIMRARLKEQEREAWREHDERVDAKLQAALSPPPPPLVESALPIADTATPAPGVAASASGGVESISNLPWWRVTYDIHDMAQSIGAARQSKSQRTSNTEIAKEIEKRINYMERSKARDRRSPSWDTIRGVLTGWAWRPE